MSDDPFAPDGDIHAPKPATGSRGPYKSRRKRKNIVVPRAAKLRDAAVRSAPEPGVAHPMAQGSWVGDRISQMPRETEGFHPEYDGPKERTSRIDRDTNQFELSPPLKVKLRAAGWDATWKVITVYNQPVDGVELLVADNAGWRAARAKDFPSEVPRGTDPHALVERFGQRLYIRPMHMTRAAQDEDRRFADAQMQSRMVANQEGRRVGPDQDSPALADMGHIVRPVAIKLEMEGETGTHGPR